MLQKPTALQLIPFADAKALALLDGFEKAIYAVLG